MRRSVMLTCCVGLLMLGIDPALLQLGMPGAPAQAPTICPVREPNPVLGAALSIGDRDDYVRAADARRSGDFDRAFDAWNAVVARNGVLAPVARFRAGEALAAGGRDAEAAAILANAAADPRLPATLRIDAAFDTVELLSDQGRDAEALSMLDSVLREPGAGGGDRARARSMEFRLRRALGDPAWVEHARALVVDYPASSYTPAALDALEDASISVPVMATAQANYRARRNSTATELYAAVVNDTSFSAAERAVAWFYLGALAERRSAPSDALDAYGRSLAIDPNGALADDSRWWRGDVLEQLGRPLEAAGEYDLLVAAYPGSSFAFNAAMQSVFIHMRHGDNGAAAERLRGLTRSRSGSEAALAARWLVVLGQARPDDPTPEGIDPTSFAAVLQRAGASATAPLPGAAWTEWSPPKVDPAETTQWMTATFGPRPPRFGDDAGLLQVGLALAEVGERLGAAELLSALLGQYRERPHDLLDLAQSTARAGIHEVSLSAAVRILNMRPPAEQLAAPSAILQLAYPAPFCDELLEASRAENVPPLLLLALVRQESAFNPQAGSSAGAQGLTQVIHPTGQGIAAALGVPWDPGDLLVPRSSLRFGAFYLAEQLRYFGGNPFAALAAYNAGPGSAQRWLTRQALPGPDGYVEAVEYTETRLYLERVIENYGWYRYIYGGAESPSMR